MTVSAAGHLLGVDRRTVARMAERGILTAYRPVALPDESPQHLFWRAEVDAVRDALARVGKV